MVRFLVIAFVAVLACPLAAEEKMLWRVAVPWYLMREAGPIAAVLDVVAMEDRDGETTLYLWETAEKVSRLAGSARSLEPKEFLLDEATVYRTYEEMNAAMRALETARPAIAKVYRIGASVEGRDILALKMSRSPAENLPGLPEVIFVGLHHAREWISAEVTLRIAEFLADHYEDTPRVGALVGNSELWFIPVLNPDGYVYSHTVDRMWRHNRRPHGDGTCGVDLNRNYDAAWMENGYVHGAGPFSEPETQALRDLIVTPEGRGPLIDLALGIVTYHSFAQLILYPWSSVSFPAPTAGRMRAAAEEMSALALAAGGVAYGVKQTYELYGAPIFGECTEWFYIATGWGTGLTIELRPAFEEEGGFRLDPLFIEPTARESIAGALYFIETFIEGTTDVVTDANGDGVIDYLEMPDVLVPDEEVLLHDGDEDSPLPHVTGGCALTSF